MDPPSIVTEPIAAEDHHRLLKHGAWLMLARAAWLVVFATVLAVYLIGLPDRIARLTTPRILAAALQQVGLPTNFHFAYLITVELLVAAVYVSVAALIFWRRSDDGTAILVSVLLLSYGPSETAFAARLMEQQPLWRAPVDTLRALGEALSLIVFYVFPDGRFVPRWTRWLAFAYAGLVLAWLLFEDLPFNAVHAKAFNQNPLSVLLFALAWHSTGLFALLYRYRTAADAVQRQQMKWVVFGLSIAFLISTARYLLYAWARVWGVEPTPAWRVLQPLVIAPGVWLGLTVAPITIGMAVLRYRLWEIDPIINRTLVYGALTASIVAIYALVVSAFSLLLQINGSFVISLFATGLVAVLFQPLRDWLQRNVNRLMYGERDEPYAVLSKLGQRLATTLTPEAVLPTVVETIAQTLKLPYVAIALTTDDQRPMTDDRAPLSSIVNRQSSIVGCRSIWHPRRESNDATTGLPGRVHRPAASRSTRAWRILHARRAAAARRYCA